MNLLAPRHTNHETQDQRVHQILVEVVAEIYDDQHEPTPWERRVAEGIKKFLNAEQSQDVTTGLFS